MANNQYLSTKAFADLCGVEKRTLFYYDEIGILQPAYVDHKNYRYYIMDQMEQMSMIKAFQSIGMSLKGIKALMEEQDITSHKSALIDQIAALQEKQSELRQAEDILKHTLTFMEDYERIGPDKPFIADEPQEYLEIKDRMGDIQGGYVNYLTYGYHHGAIIDDWDTLKASFVYKRTYSVGKDSMIKPAGIYYNMYMGTEENIIRPLTKRYLHKVKSQSVPSGQRIYIDEISGDFFKFGHKKNIFRFSTRLSMTTLHKEKEV